MGHTESSHKFQKSDNRYKKIFDVYLGYAFILELLIGVSLFFIFRSPIELFIQATLVELIFQHIESCLLVDVFWILLCFLIFIAYSFHKRLKLKSQRVSLKATLVLSVISLVYVLAYRSGEIWKFSELSILPIIKYFDVLLIYASCNFLSWSRYIFGVGKILEEQKNLGLYEDLALGGNDQKIEDLLGFRPYADRVTQLIIDTNPMRSFVIGINGEWGSGKTSFINLIDDKIRKEYPKVFTLKFNAWESSKSIIRDFFEELRSIIEVENMSLSKKLSQYSERILDLDRSAFSKLIHTLLKREEGSINLIRDQISKILELNHQKILVFIDDLDRLDKDELIQVFKLVRNSANFRNVIFLLAYDRSYVDGAISDLSEYREKRYLEKIVQLEINLPKIDTQKLKDGLLKNIGEITQSIKGDERIKKVILEGAIEVISYGDILESVGAHNLLNDYLTNLRDVKRLSNSIKINLPNLFGEVLFEDFLRLELVKLRHPKIYRSLQVNPNELLTLVDKSSNNRRLACKGEDEVKPVLKKFDYDELDVSGISNFLSEIFPKANSPLKKDPSNLSVHVLRNYPLYFKYILDENDFSETEYRRFKEAGSLEFKKQIMNWVELGKETRLRERLGIESEFLMPNSEGFKTILEGSLFLASLKSKKYGNGSVGFSRPNCQYWCLDHNDIISSSFFDGDKETYKKYIQELLKSEQEDGYLTVSNFVMKMKEIVSQISYSEKFQFDQEDLNEITMCHLAEELKTAKSYNFVLTILLNNTRDLSNKAMTWWKQVPQEASKLVMDFVSEKSIQNQLLFSFINRTRDQWKITYALNTDYFFFFKSKDEFYEFLESIEQSQWDLIDEYRSFVREWFTRETSMPPGSQIEFSFGEKYLSENEAFWTKYRED